MLNSFKEILAAAKQNEVKKLVVPCPVAADLPLLAEAAAAGLIIPILVGNGSSMEVMVNGSPLASEKYEIVDENDPESILGRAIAMIREGRGDVLMQGGAAPPKKSWMPSVTRSRGCCPKVGLSA